MTQEIEAIGLAMDTSGVEKGIKSLETLAATGPKVEKSMSGVEGAATRVNKSLATLGQGNASNGLSTVAKASDTAATSVKKVGDAASKSAREIGSIDSAAGGAGSSLAGLSTAAGLAARAVAAIGIGASVGEFVRMADASTNVASRLGLVTSSAAELASVQQRLFGIAQSSRVSFTDLVGTYAQVARSTKDLGVSQTALLGVIQTISQAVTISGGSAASAQAALTQLSQGFASGALRGEELNSILEQTPRLAQALADGLGVGVGKLRELGQAGELTSEKVLGALEKSAAGVAAEFGKMAVTVEQASTNAANSVLRLVGAFDRLFGVTSAIGGAIQTISNGLDFLSGTVDKLGSQGPLRDAAREVINLDAAAKRLRTGMQSGVLGPNAQGELDRINARLAEAKQRFRELDQQLGGASSTYDNRPEDRRLAEGSREAARLAKLRDDANAFRLNQSGVPASYLKDMTELIRLNQAGVLVGKEYTDALKAQQDVLLKKTGAVKGSASAANAEQNAYESLISSINAKIEADKLEMAGGSALTESQRIRIKLDQDLAAGRVKLSAQNERAVRLALEELSATEASALAAKTLTKATTDAAASREKYITSLATGLDKIQADITAQIEATERMGLSKEAIAELDAAKLEMLATDLELQAVKALDRNLDQQTYDALKAQAQAYRELGIAKKGGAAKEAGLDLEKANADAAKKAQEDWERASEQINSTLTDALMRGFESGKDFAKNLRDTVVNMFKTMVLRPVISAIVNPVAGAITGAMGLPGAAQAGQGGSAASTAMSAASMFGAGGLGGSLAAGAGWMTGATTLGGSLSAATSLMAAPGGLMSGLGMLAGALGPIAIGIALIASLIKKSTPHMGAASSYSAETGLVSNADIYRASGLADTRTYNAGVEQVTGNVAKAIGDTLNATAKTFGKTAGYEITTAFADDKSKDGAWGSLIIKQLGESVLDWRDTQTSKWAPREFADGEAGSKEYLAEVAKSARDALVAAIGDVDWAADMLTALGDTVSLESLAQTVQQINAAKAAFVGFGQYMPVFAAQSDAAVSAMAKASGGVDALAANMAAFVDGFYTDAERLAVNTDTVRTAIAALGLEMPATKAAMRDMVKEQIALGTEGATAAAGLLAVSGAFGQLQDAASALRTALGGAFDQLAQSLDSMHGDVSKADKRVADARMEIWSGYADAQQRVIDLEMQAADATRSFAQSLRGFVSDLATGPNSGMGLESRYRALQQQFQQTAAQAGAGDQGARDRLTGVASSYLDASRSRSRTSVDYARDEARVRVMLGNMATVAEADPLVAKYDAESLTIQQQIADAQVDVVKYLALMEATGTSTDLGIQTVDKTLAALRDEYIAAEQAQAAANLRLDVALAALDALGLTEDMVKAIAANQTNSLSAALNVSDEALASITGALGLTPENVAELGQQFAVEVALLVGQAATDLAATLQGALAFDPSQYNVLRGVLGYDQAIIAPLATALGLSPEAVQQLASQIALQDGAAELLARVADGLPLSPDAAQALQAAAEGVGLSAGAADVLGAMRAGLGLTPASAATLSAASAGIGLSAAAADQVGALLGGIMLTPAASDQVRGLLDGIPLAAADRLAVEGMLRGIGFDPAAQEDVTGLLEGIGLRAGVLQSLGTALGLSQEAMTAIGVLSNAGSLDAVVKSAYAQVGRSGFGSDVSQIDQEGFDYWRSQLATGAVSMGDFQQRFLQVAAEAPDEDLRAYIAPYMKKLGIPGFAVGTNYVPYDMVAQIHKGEAIVPAPFNPGAFGGMGNADVVAELRVANERLSKLQTELEAQRRELQAIKTASSTTATGMTGIVNKQVTLVTEAA